MRFAKAHKRGARSYAKGDAYDGNARTARFLYHRGVLEPDGSEHDHVITGPKLKTPTWTEPGEEPPKE